MPIFGTCVVWYTFALRLPSQYFYSPVLGTIDAKIDYPVKLGERFTLRLGASMFNITNNRKAIRIDQSRDRSGQSAGSNPDFLVPITYQDPFQARFSARIEF